VISGRIINFARNNATCECGRDVRALKSCSAPKPFDHSREREYTSRMLSNCCARRRALFCFTQHGSGLSNLLGERSSKLFRAADDLRQPVKTRERKTIAAHFVLWSHSLRLLIDWSAVLLFVIRLPGMSEWAQKVPPSAFLIGWLTAEILIWMLFYAPLLWDAHWNLVSTYYNCVPRPVSGINLFFIIHSIALLARVK
jgi:hypothetical protein